nr:MAG TPA: hypothetical protein [Caudoviricetes sp.]
MTKFFKPFKRESVSASRHVHLLSVGIANAKK